jgi:hypothetical protein
MGGGDGIVKALGCAKKGKGSNLILDMSWSWRFVVNSTNYQHWTQKKKTWWWFVMGLMNY